ncbi:uncharacterized protein [Primulina huaijiensis]|uniref:uncharacterized protein n=1 Tax=Primulina huaijiensis TaxID=1492673 RepID=UPI003CC6EE58
MGSCISTNLTSVVPKTVKTHCKSKSKRTRKQFRGTGSGEASSISPPHTVPFSDEETVKEVLSEIPTVAKQLSPLPEQNETPFSKAAHFLTDFSKIPYEKHPEGTVTKQPCVAFGGNELPEEMPEICSTRGCGVGGLEKIKEKRKKKSNGNDIVRDVYQKSPARLKNRPSSEVKREKTLGKSQGRATESSVDRSRPGSISSSGHGKRKDIGEISGRRSRSPVSRTYDCSSKTDLGRSPSSRRLGKSLGRVGSGLGDRLRKVDEGKESGGDKSLTSNEMLENPVVSLECFIFL